MNEVLLEKDLGRINEIDDGQVEFTLACFRYQRGVGRSIVRYRLHLPRASSLLISHISCLSRLLRSEQEACEVGYASARGLHAHGPRPQPKPVRFYWYRERYREMRKIRYVPTI